MTGVPEIFWKSNVQGRPGTAPQTQTVKVGETATFTLDTAIASSGVQWYKNGKIIPGATSNSYTTPPVTLADNFSYFIPYVGTVPAGGYQGLISVAYLYVYADGEKMADWKLETEHATWSDRDSLMYPLVYNNKLWIFEGWRGSSEMTADIWNTANIKDWELILQQAPWGTADHKSLDMTFGCVFQGKMWKMGGANAKEASNRVYNSTDGKTWEFVGNAPWTGRAAATCTVFKNKIWITGGRTFDQKLLNDIWSFDGTWKSEGNAAWDARCDHRDVVHNGRWYIIGGLNASKFLNDVWVSDGSGFTKLTTAPFKERHWFQLESYRGMIWVVAGETYGPISQLNDVWYSPDGVTWKQLKSKVVFRQRHGFGLRVFQDKLVLLGGSDFRWGYPQVSNSIWSLSLPTDFFGASNPPNPIPPDDDIPAQPPTTPTGSLSERMQSLMGKLPPTGHDLKVETIFEKDMGTYILRKIKYLSDPGDGIKTTAYITAPKKPGKKPAFVVCAQTTPVPISNGARESVNYYDPEYLAWIKEKFKNDSRYPFIDTNMFFGVELAELGYTCICPDPAFFGDFWQSQGGEPAPYVYEAGYKTAVMKNVQIHRQALRILESFADVDSSKIGVIGHSLGFFNGLHFAFFEPKIKIAILSPFNNFKSYFKVAGPLPGPDPGIGYDGYRYFNGMLKPWHGDVNAKLPYDLEDPLYAIIERGVKVFLNIPTKDPNSDYATVKPYIDTAISKAQPGNIEVVTPPIHHTFAPPEHLRAYNFIAKHFGGAIVVPIDPNPPTDPPIEPPIDNTALRIVTQPVKDHKLTAGQTATFSVVVGGGKPPYKYQWRKDGVNIAGATEPGYTTGVTGDYVVNISDADKKTIRSNPVYVRGGTTTPVEPPIDPPVETKYTLIVNVSPGGTVKKNPDKDKYNAGEQVEVTLIPDAGYEYKGENPFTVTMHMNKVFNLTFSKLPVVEPELEPPITPPSGKIEIPLLNWQPGRSDWINVDAKVTRSNDTEYLKTVWAGIRTGSQIHLPEGIIRISESLVHEGKARYLGVSIIGHGRGTTILWDGATFSGQELAMLFFKNGLSHSKIIGLTLDGNGKAATGARHTYQANYETELLYRHCHFKNFPHSAGLKFYNDYNLATSEPTVENCLFEDCKTGLAVSQWNNYDTVVKDCEFRNNGTGFSSLLGTNFYLSNTHFENNKVDVIFAGAHGSSIRRCTSSKSPVFVQTNGKLIPAPLTIQDCNVEGIVSADSTPLTVFDSEFKVPAIAIQVAGNQKLILSNIKSTGKITNRTDAITIEREGSLTVKSSTQSFLQSEVRIPGKVFEAKTVAQIKSMVEAAKAHGKDAICYLPTGKYNIPETIELTGKDYFFGGSGRQTLLNWIGPAGGTTVKVSNADNFCVDNISLGCEMKSTNKHDLLHVGGKPGRVTYYRVFTYGMYSREPRVRGLHFQNLVKGEEILLNGIEGNMTFTDSAEGTVFIPVSWEGAVVVEGKSLKRSGFIGGLGRLGSVVEPGIWANDNNSVVFSDYYSESGWEIIRLEGDKDLPPGRVTISMPKFELRKEVDGIPVVINNYKGELNLGPVLFWSEHKEHFFSQTGNAPFSLNIWGSVFSGSNPVFDLELTMLSMIGTNKPDIGDGKAATARAMDHLRELMVVADKFSKSYTPVVQPPIEPPQVTEPFNQTIDIQVKQDFRIVEVTNHAKSEGLIKIELVTTKNGIDSKPGFITINIKK